MNWSVKKVFVMAALVLIYFCGGRLGLLLAPSLHPSASAVWPPSGIALAAVLLLGYGVWPAILVGAILVNFTIPQADVAVHLRILQAVCIALGNTLEALVGAWMVERFA